MIWELIKDLNIDITHETAEKVIAKLQPSDWGKLKADLLESIKDNEKAAKQVAIISKILDGLETGAFILKLVT